MGTSSFSVLELFNLGGVIMWPLLVFSIVVVAISIERMIYFIYNKLDTDAIEAKVSEFIETKNYSGASEYLSPLTQKHMAARILLSLMEELKAEKKYSERRAERAAETEAIKCINSLESGFNFLTALGSLSPLTGFLGTVTGMIGAFRSIAEATEVNAQIVANGIYEALITTVFGLVIAIIAMVSHSIFSHFVDKFASRVEGACSSLIAHISLIEEQSPEQNQSTAHRHTSEHKHTPEHKHTSEQEQAEHKSASEHKEKPVKKSS